MCCCLWGCGSPDGWNHPGYSSLQEIRGEIRERAHLLITNPDMLHCSVLPVHRQFGRFLANLRYVVVDEGHAYRHSFWFLPVAL